DAWWESRRRSLSADFPASSPATDAVSSAAAVAPPTPHLERIPWKAAATFWTALSSDGRLLAYVSDGGSDNALPQIWLQQIGGSPVCLERGARQGVHPPFCAGGTGPDVAG